jgi:hypothetical protein
MLEIADMSPFALPAGALNNAPWTASAADTPLQFLLEAGERLESGRAAQQQWASSFDRLYEKAVRDAYSAPFLMRWAAALIRQQRAALEQINPLIEEIQRQVDALEERPNAGMLKLYQKAFDLAFGWIEPYQRLCDRLLDLASERLSDLPKDLRAHPLAGEIDHSALSREIIARFPKILAALAE